MNYKKIAASLLIGALITSTAVAAPGGKGKGNGGGNDGGDPPAEFIPEIAYIYETNKYKDLQISNLAGDQACLVTRVDKGSSGDSLQTFAFSSLSGGRLAYSIGGTIHIASFTDNPCDVTPDFSIQNGGNYASYLDVSPDGRLLVWTEDDPDSGGNGSDQIHIYDLDTNDTASLPLTGWWVGDVRFSPNYNPASPYTGNLIFMGEETQGAIKPVHLYPIGANASDEPVPVPLTSGINTDALFNVSNRVDGQAARFAIMDNASGFIYQFALDGNAVGAPISAFSGELAYSCDNEVLIHRRAVNWRNKDTFISSVDGSSSQLWTSVDYRHFNWLCP